MNTKLIYYNKRGKEWNKVFNWLLNVFIFVTFFYIIQLFIDLKNVVYIVGIALILSLFVSGYYFIKVIKLERMK